MSTPDSCPECARKDAQIAELQKDRERLKVQAGQIPFIYVPKDHRRGAGAAYHAGYEAGWRGWEYDNTYQRGDCVAAYLDGYNDGDTAANAAMKP